MTASQKTHASPAAEIDITIELITKLLNKQHPDLINLPCEHFEHGIAFRVATTYIPTTNGRRMSWRNSMKTLQTHM